MMKRLISALLFSAVSLTSVAAPALADSEVDQEETLENVMSEQGFFNRANCSSRGNVVSVRMQGSEIKNQKTLCFQNNSNWPSGSYVYNFDTDRLTHKGCEVRTNNCFNNTVINNNNDGNVVINQPPQPQQQTNLEFYALSGAPVPPHVVASLRGVAAGQGLGIGSCNVATVHVIVNNAYAFCAYPNAQYGAGKWHIVVPGLQ